MEMCKRPLVLVITLFNLIGIVDPLSLNPNSLTSARFQNKGSYRIPRSQIDHRYSTVDIKSCIAHCLFWDCCSYVEFRLELSATESQNCKVSAQDISWNETWTERQHSLLYERVDRLDCNWSQLIEFRRFSHTILCIEQLNISFIN